MINAEDRKNLATSRVETENIIYGDGMTRRKVGHMPTPKKQVSPWTENKIE